MQTNASFVRNSIAVAAALFVVACGGPQTQPTSSSPAPGSTGTGGNGSGSGSTGGGDGSGTGTGTGGTGGSGGGGGVVGTGGTGGGGGGGTGGAGGGGGTPTPMVGCYGYVQCLKAAMSAADAMACDGKATMNAQTLLGAVDTCVANYCEGMGGGTARCKAGTNGEPVNLDGSAAFDQNTGAPSGDCGTCLVNGESTLWGEACMPATDPACTATACTSQISACTNDKP